MEDSSRERSRAQQRRIMGLVVMVVLVALAFGVVIMVGSALSGLRDVPTSRDAATVHAVGAGPAPGLDASGASVATS